VRSQYQRLILTISSCGIFGWLVLGSWVTPALASKVRSKNLVQNSQQTDNLTKVTGVEVKQTPSGVQVILKTPPGQAKLVPLILPEGNNLVIDLLDATLAFSIRNGVTQSNPAPGIKEVRLSKVDATSIRVTIAGEKQAPRAELIPSRQDLVLSVTPKATAQAKPEQEIEIVVTGERESDDYAVSNSSAGTRTDAAIRDIPQSIQVIPQQVIEDQGVTNLEDALRNAPGVASQGTSGNNALIIRGLSINNTGRQNILIDGIGSGNGGTSRNLANVEQIEVLKGPASVLYGRGEAGGTVSILTKQPLRSPFYEIEGTIGNFDFYRPSLDFTGSLNDNKTVLYRLNAAYENSGSFVDFLDREDFTIAPVLSFELSKNTNLTLEGTYQTTSDIPYSGLPAVGTVLPNPLGEVPLSRFLGEPNFDFKNETLGSVGYRFDHRFNDRWSLRNRFRAAFSSLESENHLVSLDTDNRTVLRFIDRNEEDVQKYTLQTEINGKVKTGSIGHDLLAGVDFERETFDARLSSAGDVSSIDLFEPEYGNIPDLEFEPLFDNQGSYGNAIGIYAQDLLAINDQVKILLGGRFDWVQDNSKDRLEPEFSATNEDNAFSPRAGIVYQPIKPVSLYTSYSRSFRPEFGTDEEGNPLKPVTGEQFEVGVKTEFLDRKLAATLAAYQVTRQNDLRPDPDNPDFDIQVGERRSRGIEFDLTGEPLPGLQLITTYA
jgi:iron complex outermembrane recepter protein